MPKKSRVNKSKDQILAEMENQTRIEHMKVVARKIFPLLKGQKSIYDGQTAVNAAAGFIKQELEEKIDLIKVGDLTVELGKEKPSPIKTAVEQIIEILKDESAGDAAALLERMGNSLGQYSSGEYMKQPMSKIPMDKFIA